MDKKTTALTMNPRKQKCGLCHVMISLFFGGCSSALIFFSLASFDAFFRGKILNITYVISFTWKIGITFCLSAIFFFKYKIH